MISELQVSHSDGELEQLQHRETDVVVTWLLALKQAGAKFPRMFGQGILYKSNHGYIQGEKLNSEVLSLEKLHNLFHSFVSCQNMLYLFWLVYAKLAALHCSYS